MFNEGTLIFSTTPPRWSEKCVTVTLLELLLLFVLELRSDEQSRDDRSAAAPVGTEGPVFADRSKMGEAGGVLKVIRAAVAAELGAITLLLLLLGVFGELGDRLIKGASTPPRFNVNLSPP